MAKVTIPIQANLTRTDGSAITVAELREMDVFLSLDGGATFSKVATLTPNATIVVIDGIDPGSNGVIQADEVDMQSPAAMSAFASVTFSIPPVALAAPNPPTLGTPVIS